MIVDTAYERIRITVSFSDSLNTISGSVRGRES